MNFKTNSTPLFTIIFKLKNNNFKTQDSSPLIERVLAGVSKQTRDSFEPIVVHRMNNDLSDEAWEKGPTLTLAKYQRLVVNVLLASPKRPKNQQNFVRNSTPAS